MNAVEIEEAVSELAAALFDRAEFPFAFLTAFGNKETTVRRLRSTSSNSSDVAGGVLQRNNIHIATCPDGGVGETLAALRASPKTVVNKARFVLATDGATFEAEDLTSGETVACEYVDFPNHFGFFLPLAGITTVKQIRENSFDIRATGRLNRLYVELLRDNPEWSTADRRPDMNHFMARLIFCFFAEDTNIFNGSRIFTATVDRMSARDSSNTHEVIGELFLAMNTKIADRASARLPRWADAFPYVNGGLFSGSTDVPRFSRIARSYLIHIGNLDWKKINPDIFGSMIQAVADDEERGALGMHYTSVPNILKVLNPLFLDELRAHLEEAGDNSRMLLNMRRRMARIRVFDPACGSGNFLVIAYKEMRAIEAEIRLDWLSICPPTGTGVKHHADDLFHTPLDQAQIDFENEGGETYICGNPPYRGSKWQTAEQKSDLSNAWVKHSKLAKTTDFVTGWFARFFDYVDHVPNAVSAFVATNSICQGQQAIDVWPAAFERGVEIRFAHTSFKWANLASHNAGVTVVIVGLGMKSNLPKKLYHDEIVKRCSFIGPYLVPDSLAYVQKASTPIGEQSTMLFGNMPRDGGHLFLDTDSAEKLMADDALSRTFIKRFVGADELISGRLRYCLWIDDKDVNAAKDSDFIAHRLKLVTESRSKSDAESTRQFAKQPHRFVQIGGIAKRNQILVPGVSSENRPYLPCDYLTGDFVASNKCFALYDAPLWNMALIASRLHWVWIGTV